MTHGAMGDPGKRAALAFWRIRPPVPGEDIEFDAKRGPIGILSLPSEVGVLAVVFDAVRSSRTQPAGQPLGLLFDAMHRIVTAHHDCASGAVQWLSLGADGILRSVVPARNSEGRAIALRTRPLRCFPGAGGSLGEFAFIYGAHARLALISAALNFPRLVAAMVAAGTLTALPRSAGAARGHAKQRSRGWRHAPSTIGDSTRNHP